MEEHCLVERMLRANLHQRQYMQQVGYGLLCGLGHVKLGQLMRFAFVGA
jgi:hypothetical protein